jgi:hypothetical protein
MMLHLLTSFCKFSFCWCTTCEDSEELRSGRSEMSSAPVWAQASRWSCQVWSCKVQIWTTAKSIHNTTEYYIHTAQYYKRTLQFYLILHNTAKLLNTVDLQILTTAMTTAISIHTTTKRYSILLKLLSTAKYYIGQYKILPDSTYNTAADAFVNLKISWQMRGQKHQILTRTWDLDSERQGFIAR